MFIVNITYTVELERVDQLLEEHVVFLNQQYELGNFIASGRKTPRTGGIILADVEDKAELERIIAGDPFKKLELANYELIEFIPSKTSDELAFLIK